jgi:SH3-like domain-containing protein
MLAKRVFLFYALLFLLPSTTLAANNSGLEIPRFVSLKSEEVNVRSGPGTRYPIQWVYRRGGLPVEVIDEFELWRKIRDVEGTSGWVHKTMLSGSRSVMIKGKQSRLVTATPDPSGRAVLKAEPLVVGKLVECDKIWCRIQISGRKGWIEKKYLWGVYPDELID